MPQVLAFLLASFFALVAGAQPVIPEIKTRAEALKALEHADVRYRVAGVVYIGRTGLAADGPLLVRRLSDPDPYVRDLAEEAVWRVWSRSGDAEADRLLAAGVKEMEAGLLMTAIEIFTSVIERKPDFAEGWNKRATAWFLAGDMRKSLADCDEVMRRNPQHFGALSGYGQIYLQLEEYEKAIEYFRRALAVNPNMTDLNSFIRRLEELAREKRRRMI
ncbi:MAG: tetratricopeptide repeat protein [Betaproteobacteria bacterium]|nr:tetratricopeptide repeat protein [Betaproteobacteria bacterium]